MNLKDAFRYKGMIHNMIGDACIAAMSRENVYDTVEYHQKSQVIKTEKDETVQVFPNRNHNMNTFQLIKLVEALMSEYKTLSACIDHAMSTELGQYKATLDVTRQMRTVADSFSRLLKYNYTERQEVGAATYLNASGEASSYTYPKLVVSSVTFDPEQLQETIKNLLDTADRNSNMIEKKLIETEVHYEPKFSVNDNNLAAVAKKLGVIA